MLLLSLYVFHWFIYSILCQALNQKFRIIFFYLFIYFFSTMFAVSFPPFSASGFYYIILDYIFIALNYDPGIKICKDCEMSPNLMYAYNQNPINTLLLVE